MNRRRIATVVAALPVAALLGLAAAATATADDPFDHGTHSSSVGGITADIGEDGSNSEVGAITAHDSDAGSSSEVGGITAHTDSDGSSTTLGAFTADSTFVGGIKD